MCSPSMVALKVGRNDMGTTSQTPNQTARPTAQQVIARIQARVGVPWKEPTCDTFKAGDPATPVTGVAVTMFATMDVLRRAVAAGANLVITHEPTFYHHLDECAELAADGDAVLAEKQSFIAQHGLVIWRFHDYWHRRKPDGIAEGMVRVLGWQPFQDAANAPRFTLPATTLAALAADVAQRLGARCLRVIGDPALGLTRAALMPGAPDSLDQMRMLARDDVDVLLTGETREWETVEYARDASEQKRRKALIIIGHVASEEAGMAACATWLQTFLPATVPITYISTPEPFWSPQNAK